MAQKPPVRKAKRDAIAFAWFSLSTWNLKVRSHCCETSYPSDSCLLGDTGRLNRFDSSTLDRSACGATAAGSDLTIAPRHRLVRLLVTLTLAHLDRVVAVSAAMKRIGLELGLPENKCVVIHGPVGIDMPSSSQIQQRLAPEKKESQCLLYVGNLDPPKRADTIILAMSRIVNGTSDCHLVLIGTGSLRSSLEALADKLGLMGHVHFQGALERDQVFTMLTRADIFLHCSDQEGLGLAIIEAMGSGLPVVASRVGGVPELVQEGETGFMVGPDDAEGYAEKVLLLLNDEQLRKRLGSNGRRFAETHLNKRTILGQLESVYKEVLHWGENRRIK